MSANPPPFSTATTAATIAAPLTPSLLSTAAQTILTLPKTAQDTHSKRPFAALLLAPDTTTVLMTSLSLSHVRHAECELARNAADNYTWEYLASCTMVLTWEPCAMCAGTIYWANIGRLVYLAAEAALREVTGEGNAENLTLELPCRSVFRRGQTSVKVLGPLVGGFCWMRRGIGISMRNLTTTYV